MTEALTVRFGSIAGTADSTDTGSDGSLATSSSTSSLRAALVTRSMLHLFTALDAGDAPEGSELAVVDDRLRRREQLLHQLALERSRRRRRSA